MSKTSTRTSRRVGNRFWKLLGASTDKDQDRSMARVRASAEFDEKAAKLDDEQLRKAAQLLRLEDLAESAKVVGVGYEALLTRIVNLGLSYMPEWRMFEP